MYDEQVEESMRALSNYAQGHGLADLAGVVLKDPRFPVWSGSSKPFQHHYGNGGLIVHTREVADLCLLNNNAFFRGKKQSDDRKLYIAALYHDAGKMWDYRLTTGENPIWEAAPHKRYIHHISRSAMVFNEAFTKHPITEWGEAGKDEILHAILAHHGLREWGSPVCPKSRLAWMLHLCDGISARMDDADRWDMVDK